MLAISIAAYIGYAIILGGEYSSDKDILEGDIKMTPEQAALFKRGGWDGLVNSEAWLRGHGKWSRTIPYTINGVG